MDDLRLLGFSPMSPKARKIFVNAPERNELRRILPGYVFFDAYQEPNWKIVRTIPNVIRVLSYGDEDESPLRGDDLIFVNWLKSQGGIIEVSRAVREGTKVRFISGPLKDLNDRVVAVNTNRMVAAVHLSEGSAIGQKIWCAFEYA